MTSNMFVALMTSGLYLSDRLLQVLANRWNCNDAESRSAWRLSLLVALQCPIREINDTNMCRIWKGFVWRRRRQLVIKIFAESERRAVTPVVGWMGWGFRGRMSSYDTRSRLYSRSAVEVARHLCHILRARNGNHANVPFPSGNCTTRAGLLSSNNSAEFEKLWSRTANAI
jgi:hypothetical protein